jgi:hypothetical protein
MRDLVLLMTVVCRVFPEPLSGARKLIDAGQSPASLNIIEGVDHDMA